MKRSPNSVFAHGMGQPLTQFGAVCWRLVEDRPEVLLITSRDTGRWVIPKGWPVKEIGGPASALQEAWEEAGVEGEIGSNCLGVYTYDKVLDSQDVRPCAVAVYALKVSRLSRRYPEQKQRRRKWFAPQEAAKLVAEAELQSIFGAVAEGKISLKPAKAKV